MENVIICVLSAITREIGNEHTFKNSEGKEYTGFQTNIAPIKCLIDKWCNAGDDVEIEYLCSDECKELIPGSKQKTFEYFESEIINYCNDLNITAYPNRIPYDFNKPYLSLAQLICHLRDDDISKRIHIEFTGGGRDAAALLALAAQIFKMQSEYFEMGDIVYSNFQDKVIYNQNSTFNIVDLVNAVSAFTEYAKADQLVAFFEYPNSNGERPCAEIDNLCCSLKEFADALALCQVDNIQNLVRNVQKNLRSVVETILPYIEEFSNNKASLDELEDDPTALSLEEAEICRVNVKSSKYTPAEMLFATLVPEIQASFVPETKTDCERIIETIRWCTKHHLVQQALCIFVEQISPCMIELGYFKETEKLKTLDAKTAAKLRRGLVINSPIGTMCIPKEQRIGYPKETIYLVKDYFCTNKERCNQLQEAIYWVLYIKNKRNIVAHQSDGHKSYEKIYKHFGKSISDPLKIDEIEKEILEALDFIVNEPEPNWHLEKILPKQRRNLHKQKKPISVNHSDSALSLEDARNLLVEYQRETGARQVNINEEYNKWAKESGKPELARNALGLGKSDSIPKRLQKKFPDDFKADGAVIHFLSSK